MGSEPFDTFAAFCSNSLRTFCEMGERAEEPLVSEALN
jgi:hypothetical protein